MNNETAVNQTGVNETATVEQAWDIATSPENVEQFQQVFDSMGVPLALLVLIPFGLMFVYAGIRGLWEDTSFWVVFGTGLIVALMLLISFPFLLMYL